MALILEITKADGTIARTALQSQTTKVAAWPGGKVRIIDSATGKSPADITAKKVGDSLIVDGLPEGKTVEVSKFYTDCSPNAPCSVVIDPADGAAPVSITQTSQPVAALPDNQALMYGPSSDTAAIAPAAAASSGVPAGAILGGLALLGVAAAAGGGGGGGSSTPPADTTAPNAPVIANVAGDNVVDAAEAAAAAGVAVSGTAEAGSTVTVTWGSSAKTATADGSGNWSVNFASGEVPADGDTTISATARDAAGNTSVAGTRAVVVDTAVADITAPDAPVIASVAGDNIVNAAEATAGVAVAGTAEAGSTVEVTWGSATKTATADGSGNWSVNFASGEVPADGPTQISATATDAAGNTSAAGTRDIAVDKTAPVAPTALDGIDGSVSGSAEANSTVKLGAAETTADGSGNFQFAAGTLASGATAAVTAVDAAGNTSAGTDVTATSSYTLGTPGADRILGGDLDFVGGGAGSDVLIGGAGGGVRNYQFEYWNATDAGDVLYNQGGGSLITFGPSASTGWTIVSDTSSIFADPGVTNVEQFTGGDLNAGMNLLRQDAGVGVADDTGGGGRYAFDTVRNPTSGGTTLSQAIATGEGTEYTLSLQVSDNDQGTSLGVYWGGALLGLYDGVTNTWSGTAPTETDITGSRKTWGWTVEGSADPTTTLELRAYSTTADDGQGMMIDRVTLDAATPDGAETMAGGAGSDLLFGQAGDDKLYGGALGSTPAASDGAPDTFVYSMRADNGNDVIKDFEAGDRIYLVDALDTYTTDSGIPPFENPDNGTPFVNDSDANLTFRDFVQADSPGQYLTVTDDGSGSVKLTFFGQDNTGAATALGSVVLEGTEFGAGAGQYDTVEDLFTGGVLLATMDGFNHAAPIA